MGNGRSNALALMEAASFWRLVLVIFNFYLRYAKRYSGQQEKAPKKTGKLRRLLAIDFQIFKFSNFL